MKIEILGAESLGARSLCAYLETSHGNVLVDPGVSLADKRYRLPPHLKEWACAYRTRKLISRRATKAQFVVISHYHYDHHTRYGFHLHGFSERETAIKLYKGKTVFAKSWNQNITSSQRKRAKALQGCPNLNMEEADGKDYRWIRFSPPVYHGEVGSKLGFVVMTLVQEKGYKALFASDIQCLNDPAIEWIESSKPDFALLSGPPLYIGYAVAKQKEKAQERICRLASKIPLLVIDHHLVRSLKYPELLSPAYEVAKEKGHRVLTAAEFMGLPNRLLETERTKLHRTEPVKTRWQGGLFRRDPEVLRILDSLSRKLFAQER